MDSCYSFNKVCLQSSGMTPCEEATSTQDCGGSNQWFWLLAIATGVAVLMNRSKG